MNRKATVLFKGQSAGVLEENASGYRFQYLPEYLANAQAQAVSYTLPLKPEAYQSSTLFAFFDGLIPEGWLLDLAIESWKVNERDRFGLLLACCLNCIGAVSVVAETM
jgi:serine/threonine-protein kinase HipA